MSFAEKLYGEDIWSGFYQWREWWKAGRNIFDMSGGLLEMLRHTDVREIDMLSVAAPFDSFFIDLSAAGLPFIEGQPHLVEGVFVQQLNAADWDEQDLSGRNLFFKFVGDHHGHFDAIHADLMAYHTFRSYSLHTQDSQTGKGVTVGQAADEQVGILQFTADADPAVKAEIQELYRAFIDRTLSLLVNCLLYLALPDRDVTTEQVRAKLPEALEKKLRKATTRARQKAVAGQIKALDFTRVSYVGENIPRRAGTGPGESVAPHWRRGHWRRQRHGARMSEQRLTWIKPVVVNKQAGEPQKGHIYEVASPGTAKKA